jgi:hypothetical protein
MIYLTDKPIIIKDKAVFKNCKFIFINNKYCINTGKLLHKERSRKRYERIYSKGKS